MPMMQSTDWQKQREEVRNLQRKGELAAPAANLDAIGTIGVQPIDLTLCWLCLRPLPSGLGSTWDDLGLCQRCKEALCG